MLLLDFINNVCTIATIKMDTWHVDMPSYA